MDFDCVFDGQDDSDEFDEFLFDSIQKYNILQMFNLENVPYQLLQLDTTTLCVGSKRTKGENSELLKLYLPDKLTLPPEEEGRCKGNDFKVISGLYTESPLYKIDKLPKDNKIIASEVDVEGLKVYSLGQNSLDCKKEGIKLKVTPWKKSEFSVLDDAFIICSKCSKEPLVQVDVLTGKKVKDINHPFQDVVENNQVYNVNNIQTVCCSTNMIAVLNCLTGDLVLHDLRTDKFIILPKTKKKQEEIWALGSQKTGNYFGVVSSRKSFCIYDKRNNFAVHQNEGTFSSGCFEHLRLRFSGTNDRFSISGLDSSVDVYKMNENDYSHVFSHNGHNPSNLSPYLVTDHIWLKTNNKEFVVSICDNKTLNCWDYNV